MIQQIVRVENQLGLHARAAAKLVKVASRFISRISLCRDGAAQQVDAKSILGILMLAASKGAAIVVTVDGQDEVEAEAAIRTLFDDRFGEES
jgi:phosphocarrier protein HPr